jgi:hypothetical protein
LFKVVEESLSDLDDDEIQNYLRTPAEVQLHMKVWNEMHKVRARSCCVRA